MSISAIRIHNFKCFHDSGTIPIAPLTVIVGRNSAGKSSVIQPFLLLKQTLESRGFANTLNLQGPLYEAGSFAGIVHGRDVEKTIQLEISVDINGPEDLAEPGLGFPVTLALQVLDRTGTISGTAVLRVASAEPYGPRLTEICVSPRDLPSSPDVVLRCEPGAGTSLEGKWALESPLSTGWTAIPGASLGGLSMFPALLDPSQSGVIDQLGGNTAVYNVILASLEHSLREFRFMGPFRTSPKRRYDFAGKDFSDIGLEGEYAVDAIIAETLRQKSRLRNRISKWLHKSGLASELDLDRVGQDPPAYSLLFRIGETQANFADVGYGLSQVLPVLVQGLRTPQGAMFVCQQPEIHLHPDAQVALADFFFSLVAEKRSVFVETHSEHLVLGVRRILAEESTKSDPQFTRDDVSLLYVDDTNPAGAKVLPLELDDQMNVTNWPHGFMDEDSVERMRIMEAIVGEELRG